MYLRGRSKPIEWSLLLIIVTDSKLSLKTADSLLTRVITLRSCNEYMPNTDPLPSNFDRDEDNSRQSVLSKDLDQLQTGLKVDFDQKLGELTNLLAKFKSLVTASDNQITTELAANDTVVEDNTNAEVIAPVATTQATVNTTPETSSARFEQGLYKLNSQLYRFRLELDQEMEFREEPLHVHFSESSELSEVLQQISDSSKEEHK